MMVKTLTIKIILMSFFASLFGSKVSQSDTIKLLSPEEFKDVEIEKDERDTKKSAW